MTLVDPEAIAQKYVAAVRDEVRTLALKVNVLGLIASADKPSRAYARATQRQFGDVGIHYDLHQVERLQLEREILRANEDPLIHGIFIYFPVFHNQQDDYLRNLVDYRKDIEAGSMYWTRKLYQNERFALSPEDSKKALLPCTPLAIVKLLTEVGRYSTEVERPLAGKTVTIFNRSEVIGRPLAMMMSNDGARVYSFDINGPLLFINATPEEVDIDRASALRESDMVVGGVPSGLFPPIQASEIKPGAICINFSSNNNFAADITVATDLFIPRIGPMTVAMCMRNTIRLFHHFHSSSTHDDTN
jgi:methylenetetrahydrofolate dehydrogenase (NAD+)